ncbi:MAG: ATP-binding cassette domain-containing protein [Pseudomonadota bacterium]
MHLSCLNLTYSYPGSETAVFTDLSFSLPLPGFHALFGPSGVGKTSLAAILSGALEDYSGTVDADPAIAPLYTFNTERLPGWSSVGRHLEKVCSPAHHKQISSLAENFGITACLDKRFPQLSLGQKNRVNLLRYLTQDFHALIMDESLANVDESTRERIILEIKAMFPERGFIYISHNILEVARFCRKIVVLRGAGKSPASVVVDGLDTRKGQNPSHAEQDRVMLEIMNAL